MLSSRKKDKKYRTLVQKFEIKRLQAKVFTQDLSLKNRLSLYDFANCSLHNVSLVDKSRAEQNKTKQKESRGSHLPKSSAIGRVNFFKESQTHSSLQALNLLRSISRNSSLTRVKNRCVESGRSRSILRFCKLSRIVLREKASKGEIPGVVKASW